MLPSGDVSISVWDAPSLAALQEWLDLTLSTAEPGVMNTVHEVQVRHAMDHHEVPRCSVPFGMQQLVR